MGWDQHHLGHIHQHVGPNTVLRSLTKKGSIHAVGGGQYRMGHLHQHIVLML